MSRLFSLCRTIIVIAIMLAASVALADRVEAASVRLSWSDNSSNEGGFKIERRAAGGSYAQIATVGANVTSYTDSSLTSGRTYCYTVRAFNSAGTSVPAKEVCATTASTSTSSSTTSSTSTTTSTATGGSTSTSSNGSSALTLFSDNRVFVSQQYSDFLDRAPDSVGLTAWVNALNSGFPKAGLIASFMDSGEFHVKGKFIAQTYLGILRRDADYGGFRGWLGALLQGMPREQIVQFFLDSSEFKRFGNNLTNWEFVKRMYNNILLRSPDSAGLNGWVRALNDGQVARAQVALSLLDSDEFQNLSGSQNRVDISLLYFDMLRRDPDVGGFSGWIEALNSGLPLTAAVDAFLLSGEYRARFCNCLLQ